MDMDMDKYQTLARRTRNNQLEPRERLLNLTLGLAGEVGEFVDHVKKVLYHGHELKKDDLREELGDVQWYLSMLADEIQLALSEVARANIAKLSRRYPTGFSEQGSRERERHEEHMPEALRVPSRWGLCDVCNEWRICYQDTKTDQWFCADCRVAYLKQREEGAQSCPDKRQPTPGAELRALHEELDAQSQLDMLAKPKPHCAGCGEEMVNPPPDTLLCEVCWRERAKDAGTSDPDADSLQSMLVRINTAGISYDDDRNWRERALCEAVGLLLRGLIKREEGTA